MANEVVVAEEFGRLRDQVQSAITEFEERTGLCVCDISLSSKVDQFHSFSRPKPPTSVSFIELGGA